MQTYTLREAAELCGMSVVAFRGRADRGSIRTVQRDGVRYVPHSELERAGLLPGAELRTLKVEVERLNKDLAVHRQLVESTQQQRQAEQQARETAEAALHEQRAQTTMVQEKLEVLEHDLAGAGPFRAWKIVRELRRQS